MEIIAHRGASCDAPENTLASIQRAWQQNADAVEVDVLLTKDKQVVAIHDETTKRLAGRDQAVKEQTLAELKTLDVGRWKSDEWAGQRIPTLEEVLETIPAGKRLFIEVKTGPEIIPHLMAAMKTAGRPPSETTVIGYSLPAMTEIKTASPDLQVYLVAQQQPGVAAHGWVPSTDQLICDAKAAHLDGLDLNTSQAINEQSMAAIKQAGLQLYVWTVNSLQEASRLQTVGVDGVTTDRPGWLRQQLETMLGNRPV